MCGAIANAGVANVLLDMPEGSNPVASAKPVPSFIVISVVTEPSLYSSNAPSTTAALTPDTKGPVLITVATLCSVVPEAVTVTPLMFIVEPLTIVVLVCDPVTVGQLDLHAALPTITHVPAATIAPVPSNPPPEDLKYKLTIELTSSAPGPLVDTIA